MLESYQEKNPILISIASEYSTYIPSDEAGKNGVIN